MRSQRRQDSTPAEIFRWSTTTILFQIASCRRWGLSHESRVARPFHSTDRPVSRGEPSYRGISLDLEEIPSEAQQSYMALLAALYQDFQAHNWKLYINTPVATTTST